MYKDKLKQNLLGEIMQIGIEKEKEQGSFPV